MAEKKMGLAVKFILFISTVIILTSLSLSWFFISSQVTHVRKALVDKGKTLARNLAYNSEYAVVMPDPAFARELLVKLLETVEREEDVLYSLVMDKEGEVLAMLGEVEPEQMMFDIENDLNTKKALVRFYRSKNGEPIYDIAIPIKSEYIRGEKLEEETVGMARVGISLVTTNKAINKVKQISFVLTSIVILIGILAAVLLVRLIIKPLRRLLLGTQKVAQGDLTYRVAVRSNDEVGELSGSFNQMAVDLEKSRQVIEGYAQTLEQRVEQRTKQLKEAESNLIQSAKMAAVGQLGAGVAHELNNPLGGILGYAQFMLEKLKTPGFNTEDFKNCQKYIESIEKESTRCKNIVENLLKFSRKPISAAPEPVDINKAIEETLSIIGHQLKLKNIKVTTAFAPGLAEVKGIVNQLQQVFTNLILNAQQAMPEGGELRISVENINNEKARGPEQIRVEFKDSGSGIAAENLAKIFEPFFTTKRKEKGTGLGLSVSYQIIQDHQGTIEVTSEAGKGTTFVITLPAIIL